MKMTDQPKGPAPHPKTATKITTKQASIENLLRVVQRGRTGTIREGKLRRDRAMSPNSIVAPISSSPPVWRKHGSYKLDTVSFNVSSVSSDAVRPYESMWCEVIFQEKIEMPTSWA
ncbi:hypothetical protein ACTXT7_010921 [Hymenolepis weldensis]